MHVTRTTQDTSTSPIESRSFNFATFVPREDAKGRVPWPPDPRSFPSSDHHGYQFHSGAPSLISTSLVGVPRTGTGVRKPMFVAGNKHIILFQTPTAVKSAPLSGFWICCFAVLVFPLPSMVSSPLSVVYVLNIIKIICSVPKY